MFTRNSDSNSVNSSINHNNDQKPEAAGPGGQGKAARETVIGNDLTIHGNVASKGIVRLEGTVVGDMDCSSLIVEKDGSISGNVTSEEVDVHGKVEGVMHGQTVKLYSSSMVDGDIYHQGIGIELGAKYEGRLKQVNNKEEGIRLSNEGKSLREKKPLLVNDNNLFSKAAE